MYIKKVSAVGLCFPRLSISIEHVLDLRTTPSV